MMENRLDCFVKRSWAEISLRQIVENLNIYKENMPKAYEIMAVIKADAYGHGDEIVAKRLQEQGITKFAVSNIDEACKLRKCGIIGEILILGYTPIDQLHIVYDYDITQAVISKEYADKIVESKLPIKCQIALDTGMNRIGIKTEDYEYCEKIIRKYNEKLNVTGLFTHLCVADTDRQDDVEFTKRQLEKFENIVNRTLDLKFSYNHCLNSAAGLKYKTNASCLVRLGIILYGLKPDYENELPYGIKPTMTWKSVVAMVKTVYTDETVGYGRSYKATKEMKIATIPTGYADGYSRALSNRGYVLINEKRAPIVGKICMDQFMVDVSQIENVDVGTEVILLGKSGNEILTADDMAEMLGTIGYEVVCDIGKRVPRIYI